MARYRIQAEANADIDKIYVDGIEGGDWHKPETTYLACTSVLSFWPITQTPVSIQMSSYPVCNGFVMAVMSYSLPIQTMKF